MEKKRRKIEKGKVENGRRESYKMKRGTFFRISLFKTADICFGSTKMGINFYREEAFPARKKIRKNDFAPL